MMKWPKYIRVQRQEQVLQKRLKVPASIAQFQNAAERNLAGAAFDLFKKYSPPNKAERKERLKKIVEAKAKGEEANIEHQKQVKFGLKHVTNLIQRKKAQVVLIAHDVQPLELVVWLPTLRHKMDVPYAIVKGKAALGKLVGMKTATCLCLTEVEAKDSKDLENLTTKCRLSFNDTFAERKVRTQSYGAKTTARLARETKAVGH
jgi:large subunit ribosomal protein L7Ae